MSPESTAILWIARMRFFPDLRIREVELMSRVARRRKVYALDRSDPEGWDRPNTLSKLKLRWDLATGGWSVDSDAPVTRFRMPVYAATGPILSRLAARANERAILKALDRFGCDTVFHSHPFFFLPPTAGRRPYRAHFDLVDNFIDEFGDTRVGRSRRRFLLDAILAVDSLSAVSPRLCDRVEALTGRRPAYVPNGAALDEIRAWPEERAARVRERLGLGGKKVLTYIGNHMASCDGMDMLWDAFREARKSRPDLALIIVGPSPDREGRRPPRDVPDGVHVVGPVPTASVWDYFHAADVGLLPFVLSPGTHDSLPLKVLEFGAAGKPMLVTPLSNLRSLELPHVKFVAHDAAAWTRALLDEATYVKPDGARLDEALKPYRWEKATDALIEAMGA